ncbi:MAG: PBP1A family penicillin-binding protein [Acidimicrobiia bacterium]|nr:PBP1A family penicillin-binding protein [Acidimicrobiia bacterium]
MAYDDLPKSLIDAVVAAEDQRFWDHPGVDLRAILRAAQANGRAGEIVQGGSTITQQYIKNVLLTPEVSLDRKLEEAALAVRLEEGLSKQEILERYLNTIYLGDGAYGVGTAAANYFGKHVGDLTLGEASLLAGLIRAPSTTNPRTNPEVAVERRKAVLEKMVDLGHITQAKAVAASTEPIELAPPFRRLARSRYPYFVEALKQQLLDDVRLGETPTDRYNALFNGGLRIQTTLNPTMQSAAEEAFASVIGDEADRPDTALVSIEPGTGYVRALVGGRDFYDATDPIAQFNLATQGRRQPGSAFKPFVLAAALEDGVGLYDVFEAGGRVEIETGSDPWIVENFNNAVFPRLTVLEATVFSVNTVYARLMDRVGPEKVKELAERAGLTPELEPFLSLVLGAQEVSPFEMASAYGVFAAGGVHVAPVLFTSIQTHDGSPVVENDLRPVQAIDQTVADQVTMALTEVVRRGTGQRARIGRPIAGKTGTSQDHRDAWYVGYTPELVTSVWVGYAQYGEPMEPPLTPFTITGGSWPAQIWGLYSAAVLAGVPYSALPTVGEGGTVAVDIDLTTGYVAEPFCSSQSIQTLKTPPSEIPTATCPGDDSSGLVDTQPGEVPAVGGLELAEAVTGLTRAGYEVRLEWKDGGDRRPGTIIGQTPEAGTPVESGSIVMITLAGPTPGAVVPGVLGLSRAEALEELDEIGVGVDVIIEGEPGVVGGRPIPNRIWKQSPPAGSTPSASVTIWLNPEESR